MKLIKCEVCEGTGSGRAIGVPEIWCNECDGVGKVPDPELARKAIPFTSEDVTGLRFHARQNLPKGDALDFIEWIADRIQFQLL